MSVYQIHTTGVQPRPRGSRPRRGGIDRSSSSACRIRQPLPRSVRTHEGLAWSERASDLADWALANVVVRDDCYGSYRRIPTANGIEVKPTTVHDPLTRDRLIRHFRGEAPEERVAVHIVSPDRRDLQGHDR